MNNLIAWKRDLVDVQITDSGEMVGKLPLFCADITEQTGVARAGMTAWVYLYEDKFHVVLRGQEFTKSYTLKSIAEDRTIILSAYMYIPEMLAGIPSNAPSPFTFDLKKFYLTK